MRRERRKWSYSTIDGGTWRLSTESGGTCPSRLPGDFGGGGLAEHGEDQFQIGHVVAEVFALQPLEFLVNGSAFGLGMDWMMRKAASVLTASVL